MPFLILLSSLHICPQVPGRCCPRALRTVCGMAYTVRCAGQNFRSMSSNNPLGNTSQAVWLQLKVGRLCMEVPSCVPEGIEERYSTAVYQTSSKLQ